MIYIQIILGFIILVGGAEFLVRGGVSIASRMGVSPLVLGMTIVAIGTSAPELMVSINAAHNGATGLAVGNVIGSNIANVLFALPLAFLIRIPKSSDLKIVDNIYLLLATFFYIYITLFLGVFNNVSGFLMLFLLLSYLTFILFQASRGLRKVDTEEIEKNISLKRSVILSFLGLLGISQTIIGLTVVALGTSIPEVVTSMAAAYRGQISFVLGAILGSNLFNLLAITGIASVITPINTKNILDKIDVYYLIFSTIIFVLISLFLKYLSRKLIVGMLISYAIYVVFIYLRI